MSNENIFREVDEELRSDRMRALWKRYGPYLIGAAVLVVLGVGINEGWRWWQNSTAARSSDLFYSAIETAQGADVAAAQEALNAVVAQGSGDYPLLARFRQAALLARDGRTAEAVAAYDALANSSAERRIRELALVLAANLLVDGGDVAAVQQRVAGLVDPANPLRNAAREAIGLAQYKAGDLAAALRTLDEIVADPLAGNQMRSRVQVYVAQLVAMGATPPEPAETAAATTPEAAPAEDATAEPASPAGQAQPQPTTASPAAPVTTATPTTAAMPTTTAAP